MDVIYLKQVLHWWDSDITGIEATKAKFSNSASVFINVTKSQDDSIHSDHGHSCGQGTDGVKTLFEIDANRQTYWVMATVLALRLELGFSFPSWSSNPRSNAFWPFRSRGIHNERCGLYDQ